MPQIRHYQHGLFHVTTCTNDREPWCILPGVPRILIDQLFVTKNVYDAEILAFCILPDHMHTILDPGERGLTRFMQSFKSNASREIRRFLSVGTYMPMHPHLRTWESQIPLQAGFCTRSKIGSIVCPNAYQEPRERGLPAAVRGTFFGWQNGFHDKRIRDIRQRDAAMSYVIHNAVRHGLVHDIDHWPWSSAHFSNLIDA